jgi:hypothetical protein
VWTPLRDAPSEQIGRPLRNEAGCERAKGSIVGLDEELDRQRRGLTPRAERSGCVVDAWASAGGYEDTAVRFLDGIGVVAIIAREKLDSRDGRVAVGGFVFGGHGDAFVDARKGEPSGG